MSFILADFHKRARNLLVPISVTIELTKLCNLKCIHCYNFNRSGKLNYEPHAELTKKELISLLRELRARGTLQVCFTGGEPLLHPHFFNLMDEARRLNFSVSVLTNATLITKEAAKKLKKYPNLSCVSISLYGSRKNIHDRITKVTGSFVATMNAIKYLQDEGVPIKLKLTILTLNFPDIENMITLAKRMGVKHTITGEITARYDGSKDSLLYRVPPIKLKKIYENTLKDVMCTKRSGLFEDFKCNCALSKCAISSNGDVYPCIAVPWSAGNIRNQPFIDIWFDSAVFERIRNLKLEDFTYCKDCKYIEYCRRNNGTCYTYSGQYTGIDPWVCQEAKLIYQLCKASQ